MTDWLADEPLTWHKHWRDEAGVDWWTLTEASQ